MPIDGWRGLQLLFLEHLVGFPLHQTVVHHQQTADTVLLVSSGLLGRRRVHTATPAAATGVTRTAVGLAALVPVQHNGHPAFVVHYFPRRCLVLQLQRMDRFADDFRYCGNRCNILSSFVRFRYCVGWSYMYYRSRSVT